MYMMPEDTKRHHEDRVAELGRQYQYGKWQDEQLWTRVKAMGSRVSAWFGGGFDSVPSGESRLEPQPVRVEIR